MPMKNFFFEISDIFVKNEITKKLLYYMKDLAPYPFFTLCIYIQSESYEYIYTFIFENFENPHKYSFSTKKNSFIFF